MIKVCTENRRKKLLLCTMN